MNEFQNSDIRLIKDEEKKEVRRLLRRCFPITEWWPFTFSDHTLVALKDDKIVGCVVLKFYNIYKKGRVGFLEYIFTAPEVRGLGYGQKLVDASIRYFKENDCNEMITQVKGDNTSSSKLFSTRGFNILSPGQQLRRYKLGIFGIWLKTKHLLAKGQFLWVRTEIDKSDKPALQWWGNLIANIVVFFFFTLRPEILIQFNFQSCIAISAILLFYFSIRYLAMKITALKMGLSLRYYPIEDWFGMSFILALASAVWVPVPGNLYPKEKTWSYRDIVHKLGPSAFMGSLITSILTWCIFLTRFLLPYPSEFLIWIDYAFLVGADLAFLDTVFPFFPLEHYSGRRIYDWNKHVWAILAMVGLGTFIYAFFFF